MSRGLFALLFLHHVMRLFASRAGERRGGMRYAVALACFALIRRWRAKLRAAFLPPTGGGLFWGGVRGVM